MLLGGAVAAKASSAAPDDEDGFVELKVKKRKDKKKPDEAAPAGTSAEAPAQSAAPNGLTVPTANGDHDDGKHVHFGQYSPRTGPHKRRPSLKPADAAKLGGDTAIVTELRSIGFSVTDILDCIEQLTKSGVEVTDAAVVLAALQERELTAAAKKLPSGGGAPNGTAAPAVAVGAAAAATAASSGKSKKDKTKSSTAETAPVVPVIAVPAASTSSADGKVALDSGRHSSLADRIEAQAKASDPHAGDDSLDLVQKWASMLDHGSRHRLDTPETEGNAVFFHTFMVSRGLEELLRRLLEAPKAGSALSQKVEVSLLKILGATLFGFSAYHKWLLQQLQQLARPLEACPSRKLLTDKILFLITTQKQARLAQSEVNEIPTDIKKGTPPPPKPKAPVAAGAKSSKDPFTELQEATDDAAVSLQLRTDSVKQTFSAMNKVMSSPQLTATFRKLEQEIQSHTAQARGEIEALTHQRSGLGNKRDGLDTHQKSELQRLSKEQQQLTTDKLVLEERRR